MSSEALQFKHIFESSIIQVIDYGEGPNDYSREVFNNAAFLDWLQNEAVTHPPMKVRWINAIGVSWDVVSALADKYRRYAYFAKRPVY
jgi:hypothetical protein